MDNRERRSRIRSSIRDYYDLQQSPERKKAEENLTATPSTTGGGAAGDASPNLGSSTVIPPRGDELNMDSESFNSATYTTKILKEKTLKQLYEKDTELRKKVRELDGELQDLVYNNYTNFIAATDTIRDMKGNVEDMDKRLSALSSNVERIDDVSKTIRSRLEDHRGKIEEVLAVNKMLQKIRFLVALPEAMKKFVDNGRYSTAAKYWSAGDMIFKKYSSIASFQTTHNECREIAEECYKKLLQRIKTTDLEADKIEPMRADVEALRAMLPTSISAEPSDTFDEDMLTFLFQHAKEAFSNKVGAIFLSVEQAFKKYDDTLAKEFSVENLKKRASSKFKPRHSRSASDAGGDEGADEDTSSPADGGDEFEGPQLDLDDALEQLKDAAFVLKVHRLRARDILMSEVPKNFPDLLMQDVFPVISQVLKQVSSQRSESFKKALVLIGQSLAHIATEAGATASNNASANNVTTGVAEQLVKTDPLTRVDLFLTCMIRELRKFGTVPTKALRLDQLVDIHDGRGGPDEEDLSPRCSYTDDCLHQVESLAKDEMLALVNFAEKKLIPNASFETNNLTEARALAVMSGILKQIGKSVVPNIRSALGSSAVETALRQALHSVSKTLSATAVEQISGFLTVMLCDAFESGRWCAKKAPTEVSAFLPIIVDELKMTESLLYFLIPGDHRSAAGGRGGGTRGGSTTGSGISYGGASSAQGGGRSGVGSRSNAAGSSSSIPVVATFTRREHKLSLASGNMDRLLAGKVGALSFKPTSVDSPHLMECIVLSLVKGWTEAVRGGGKVYNKGGFNQLQVDASYLLLCLKEGVEGQSMGPASDAPAMPHVPVATGAKPLSSSSQPTSRFALLCHKDERLVDSVTELLCSVYERCTEKIALPPAEVEVLSRAQLKPSK